MIGRASSDTSQAWHSHHTEPRVDGTLQTQSYTQQSVIQTPTYSTTSLRQPRETNTRSSIRCLRYLNSETPVRYEPTQGSTEVISSRPNLDLLSPDLVPSNSYLTSVSRQPSNPTRGSIQQANPSPSVIAGSTSSLILPNSFVQTSPDIIVSHSAKPSSTKQSAYSTPGSTLPSFFNPEISEPSGGPTQKLFTNSLPQHAYSLLQSMFGSDPEFTTNYASLQDLYEFLSKKFSVMKNFGYDGSYIEVI